MDGNQVAILKETDEVGLRSFLKGKNGLGLEPQFGPKVLSDLADEALEREPVGIVLEHLPIN